MEHIFLLFVSVLCRVCHVFPRLHFSLSTRYSPVFLSVSTLPCPALPYLESLKTVYLSYILVCMLLDAPSCVHCDRRPDRNCKRHPFTSVCFFVFESLLFCSCVSVPRLTQAHRSRVIAAAVLGSPKPAVRGRSTPLSAAHSSPPFVGDQCCRPRFTQARRSREIDATVRGSLKPTVRGRSTPPSMVHPSPPFAGDRRHRPRLTQAHRSWEIDAAVHGSPKPAVRGRSVASSVAHSSPPFVGDQCCRPWLTQARRLREINAAVRSSPKPAAGSGPPPWIQFPNHGQECRCQVPWIQFLNHDQECSSQVSWIQFLYRITVELWLWWPR